MNTIVQPTTFKPEGPQPLLREIAPGEPYPVDALGPLAPFVEAIHDATQAPVAIAAQSVLSVASMAVQGHADVQKLNGYTPVSLYCLTIAKSGERKSSCDQIAMRAFNHYERAQDKEYSVAMTEWERERAVWKAKHDRMIRDVAGTSVNKATEAEADLVGLGPEPKRPLAPKLTTSEPTLEGLCKMFMHGQPSLGLFSDEGGGFLGGHAMNAENRLKTLAGLNTLWDSGRMDRTRAGDGAHTLYGRRLSMHLMVQPIAAAPLLADPVANGQGFLARFLITEPPSAIGTRLAASVDAETNPAVIAALARMDAILGSPKPTIDGEPHELDPRQLRLSPDALDLLKAYGQIVEAAQAPGSDLDGVTSFASKSPELAARIAGVLTLWADLGAVSVGAETMADAIRLAEFYLYEAKRLAEAAVISAEVAQAETLRKWILNVWPETAIRNERDPETILPADVTQYGPGAFRETKKATALLNTLAQFGWVVALDAGALVDGKTRKTAYRIVRAV